MHGAPADDVHDRVAGLLEAQCQLDEVAAVAGQLEGAGFSSANGNFDFDGADNSSNYAGATGDVLSLVVNGVVAPSARNKRSTSVSHQGSA